MMKQTNPYKPRIIENSNQNLIKRPLMALAKYSRSQKLALITFVLLMLALPVTTISSLKQKELRSRASNLVSPPILPTVTPSIAPTPANLNSISWKTDYVSLNAGNFYILTDGKKYFANTGNVTLNSDPPDPPGDDYTTLEAGWMENEVEMRLNMYFYRDGDNNWWLSEARTYNGQNSGDWIYFNKNSSGKLIEGRGEKLLDSLDIMSDSGQQYQGKIHFENIKLQPFTTPYIITPTTTPTPYAELKLQLASPSSLMRVGEKYDINILINTNGEKVISSDALVKFDSDKVTINPDLIRNGNLFPYFTANQINNDNNRYLITSWYESTNIYLSTNIDTLFASFNITAKKEGQTTIQLECNPGSEADSNINYSVTGQDIIKCPISPLIITINSATDSATPTPDTISGYPDNGHMPKIANITLPQGKLEIRYNELIRGYDTDLSGILTMDFSGLPNDITPRVCYSYLVDNKKVIDCIIGWTPHQEGIFPVTITVTDDKNGIVQKTVPLTINQ